MVVSVLGRVDHRAAALAARFSPAGPTGPLRRCDMCKQPRRDVEQEDTGMLCRTCVMRIW